GPKALERGRQLEQAQARRLRHRARRLALDQHEDSLVRLEPVGLDHLEDGAVAVEERRRAQDELQLELGMLVDCPHRGLDRAVVRPAADDDADLPHASTSSVSTVSAGMSRRAVRPTTSSRRLAGMPVPGFFAASIARSMTAPAGMSAAATTDFSNTCFISAKGATSSLSTGDASIASISRIPSTSSSRSSGSSASAASGP